MISEAEEDFIQRLSTLSKRSITLFLVEYLKERNKFLLENIVDYLNIK